MENVIGYQERVPIEERFGPSSVGVQSIVGRGGEDDSRGPTRPLT